MTDQAGVDGIPPERTYRAWPGGSCDGRRDEHADQALSHRFSMLDITDHAFTAASGV